MANIDRTFAGAAAEINLQGTMTPTAPGPGATFVITGDVSSWPSVNFVVLIDSEKLLCSARSGTTFTVAAAGRGFDGTAGSNHGNNAAIIHLLDAAVMTAIVSHVNNLGLDHHLQYLNNLRHDDVARHQAGTSVPVATPAGVTPGNSAGEGTAPTLARSDHRHAMAPWGTLAQLATQVIGTGAEGVLDAFARIDHVHPQAVVLPSGIVLPFAGAVIPAGWLLCDGAAVSRTTYAGLFAVVGTTYGTGNGSTTFNLPDLRERVVVGQAAAAGYVAFRTLGGSGGAAEVALGVNDLAPHSHTVDPPNTVTDAQGNHYHSANDGYSFITTGVGGTGMAFTSAGGNMITTAFATPPNHAHNVDIASFSTGNTPTVPTPGHNNLQPYRIMQYMVKT